MPEEQEQQHGSEYEHPKAKGTHWSRLRRFFFPTRLEKWAQLERRLAQLTEAIEESPQAAVNYVLRGEAYEGAKRYVEARADYEQALELAREALQEEDWGIAAQAIQERAEQGLRRIAENEG